MNLDLTNSLINSLKEKEFIQKFMEELSKYLEKNTNNYNIECDNLHSKDLTIDNTKIIAKYRDEMLLERGKILKEYSELTKNKGELLYIYNVNDNLYNLTNCTHEVITKKLEELPKGSTLGSVLRKKDNNIELDIDASKEIAEKVNAMIKEKIEEQQNYLENKRVEGHTYKLGEKYSERVWLYDLDNKNGKTIEGFEEIDFPKELYENAKEGDLFVYKEGKYIEKKN